MPMDSLRDRARETLALLLEVSRSFHALIGVDALLQLITEKLRVLLDAEACSVILYDAERHELYFPESSDDRLGSTRPCAVRRRPSIGTTSSCDGPSATTSGGSSGPARCSVGRSTRRAAPRRPGRP